MIENERRSVVTEHRGVNIMTILPSVQTVKHYTTMVANQCGISIDGSTTIAKTNNRFTAENSIISAVSLGLSILYANYIPITKEDPLIAKDMDDALVGVKIMYDMVCNCYGSPIYTVKPQYMLSTNSTIVYVFSGVGTSAPLFITVTDMSEKELSLYTSLIVEAKGFFIGGGGINIGCDGVGYILFMRKKENCDMVKYACYQK